MNRKKTNTVLLGVNACLLIALLTGGFAVGPSTAASVPPDKSGAGSGIPNAARQRQEMTKKINELTVAVKELRAQMQKGVSVRVENAEEIARAMQQ